MKVIDTDIEGVKVLEPRVFEDARGSFFESYNKRDAQDAIGVEFVQDNHSTSQRGVLRGLHYQVDDYAQGKLVRVVVGSVFDVVVDLRRSSTAFGRWIGHTLSAENRRQMWIPEGFAHGFLVLSDRADFLYKTTAYYSAADERCIRWDDEDLAIEWPLDGKSPLVSDKDARGIDFRLAPYFP